MKQLICMPADARDARALFPDAMVVDREHQLDDLAFQEKVFVWGSQRLLARVAQHLDRRGLRTSTQLILINAQPSSAFFASKLFVAPRHALDVARGHAHVDDVEVGTLKVALSAGASSELCFSFALGGWVDMIDAANDTASRWAAIATSMAQPFLDRPELRLVKDGTPQRGVRHLYASSCRRGALGLVMSTPASVRLSRQDLEPSRAVLPLLRRLGGAVSGEAESFKRIHIEVTSGYVIDDESYAESKRQTLVIEPGPTIRLGA